MRLFHGRIIAPFVAIVGVLAIILGIVLVKSTDGFMFAYGVAEVVSGVIGLALARGLWRYQENQRRQGWPE